MARLPRFDLPGRWFHVMNRGLARRPIFETERDVRYFLSRVAHAVRRGELEVHVFCVMTTHYHLLVRSPVGKLSEAMRRIQNEYVRYFNRTRRRDGPLFRGRFVSKPVLSSTYRRILVRYIDANPVDARLAKRPWQYPHGSAMRFVSTKTPPWLCKDWIMGRVAEAAEAHLDADYCTVWGRGPTSAERELVELRTQGGSLPAGGLDDLVEAAPAGVYEWMVRKTNLADNSRPGLVCVPPRVVVDVVRDLKSRGRSWRYLSSSEQRRTAWGIAAVGLLRELAGQTYSEIAGRLGLSTSTVTRRARIHAELRSNADYASRLGRVGWLCVRAAYATGRRKSRDRS